MCIQEMLKIEIFKTYLLGKTQRFTDKDGKVPDESKVNL